MGQRSRKRGRTERAAGTAPPPATAPSRRERSEARDQAIREGLQPLAPGERPKVVTVAVFVALAYAAANLIAYAAGVEVSGRKPAPSALVLPTVVLVVSAWGMWRARYWAVLGFEMLLALTLIGLGLSLLVASTIFAALFCLAVGLPTGFLFWKLIRAMARLQMPERPQPQRPSM